MKTKYVDHVVQMFIFGTFDGCIPQKSLASNIFQLDALFIYLFSLVYLKLTNLVDVKYSYKNIIDK